MRFAWRPMADAAVYRLEFHDRPPPAPDADPAGDSTAAGPLPPAIREPRGAPVSGVVVPATVNAVGLSPLALTHLAPGHSYWWRVVAYARDGRLIGRSAMRRLDMPPETP